MQKIFSQKGSALIVSLIILIVLSLIGVATLSTSQLQLGLAMNAQETVQSFQVAQSALDAVNCLVINDSSKNPYKKRYQVPSALQDNIAPATAFDWNSEAENPFEDNTGTAISSSICSVSGGQVSHIDDEKVAITMISIEPENCPRVKKGSSSNKIKCNSYVTRSQHQYAATNVETNNYVGYIRQVPVP